MYIYTNIRIPNALESDKKIGETQTSNFAMKIKDRPKQNFLWPKKRPKVNFGDLPIFGRKRKCPPSF